MQSASVFAMLYLPLGVIFFLIRKYRSSYSSVKTVQKCFYHGVSRRAAFGGEDSIADESMEEVLHDSHRTGAK